MIRVFLSYSNKDKPLAKRLASDLLGIGLDVWFDEWTIKVGDSIVQKIEQGLSESDFVVVLLTSSSVDSGWVAKEWQSKVGDEAESKNVSILPVRAEECKIPILLKSKKYADIEHDYKKGFEELLSAIRTHTTKKRHTNNNVISEPKPEKSYKSRVELYDGVDVVDLISKLPFFKAIIDGWNVPPAVVCQLLRDTNKLDEFYEELKYKLRHTEDIDIIHILYLERFDGMADEHAARYFLGQHSRKISHNRRVQHSDEDDFIISTKLRSAPTILEDDEVKSMLVEKDYFDCEWNVNGKGMENHFQPITRDGNDLIYDGYTNLTWQREGSKEHIVLEDALQYIGKLNTDRFGGYIDWRFPTLEEAMSILKPVKNDRGLFIDPMFSPVQRYIWSEDKSNNRGNWGADFTSGSCGISSPGDKIGYLFARAVR